MFISRAMNPALYTRSGDVFAARRDELNIVLAFSGIHVGDDGKLRRSTKAENHSSQLAHLPVLRRLRSYLETSSGDCELPVAQIIRH